MERIGTLFGDKRQLPKKTRRTERGDIYDVLLSMLNIDRRGKYKPLTHGRLGFLLQGIPTRDLYALVSKMRDGERRGVAPGMVFWTEIRPKDQN